VSCLLFHPLNPDILISGAVDSTIRIWTLNSAQQPPQQFDAKLLDCTVHKPKSDLGRIWNLTSHPIDRSYFIACTFHPSLSFTSSYHPCHSWGLWACFLSSRAQRPLLAWRCPQPSSDWCTTSTSSTSWKTVWYQVLDLPRSAPSSPAWLGCLGNQKSAHFKYSGDLWDVPRHWHYLW